jgi:hypothetical protein
VGCRARRGVTCIGRRPGPPRDTHDDDVVDARIDATIMMGILASDIEAGLP